MSLTPVRQEPNPPDLWKLRIRAGARRGIRQFAACPAIETLAPAFPDQQTRHEIRQFAACPATETLAPVFPDHQTRREIRQFAASPAIETLAPLFRPIKKTNRVGQAEDTTTPLCPAGAAPIFHWQKSFGFCGEKSKDAPS